MIASACNKANLPTVQIGVDSARCVAGVQRSESDGHFRIADYSPGMFGVMDTSAGLHSLTGESIPYALKARPSIGGSACMCR